MTNELQVFNFEQEKQVRVLEKDSNLWFVAKDVATILGYQRTADAVRTHVATEDKLTRQFTDSGQKRDMTIINESGLYSLIFASKLPSAKKFKQWVTSEVLPTIRKYGMYLSEPVREFIKDNPDAITNIVENYVQVTEKCKQLENENENLQKKIKEELQFSVFGRSVVAATGSVTFQNAAHFLAQKGIDIGQNRLYKDFREQGLIGKRKGKQWNKPTQKGITKGFVNLQVGGDGDFHAVTMITPLGMKEISNKYMKLYMPVIYAIEQSEEEEARND